MSMADWTYLLESTRGTRDSVQNANPLLNRFLGGCYEIPIEKYSTVMEL